MKTNKTPKQITASVSEVNGTDWATAGTHPDKRTARQHARQVIASRKAQGLGSGKYSITLS